MRIFLNYLFLSLLFLILLFCLVGCGDTAPSATQPPAKATGSDSSKVASNSTPQTAEYPIVEWIELIPDDDLKALENPPEYLNDIVDGSEEDSLETQLKMGDSPAEDRYQQALNSEQTRPEFDGRKIRIAGFIVPLLFDDQQKVTTFFVVPFFGACIHMPPPPPNQIIFAEYEPGIKLESLYDPYWLQGTLSTTVVENDMATAAYSMSVEKLEIYELLSLDEGD